jgi:hypothetical protein
VHLVTRDSVESWPEDDKQTVAGNLVARIAVALGAAAK